ncbi:O-methyltransferase [Xylariales sp. AK1849]|nr:O-methyltransferase [Xylariales sp. AK1849]
MKEGKPVLYPNDTVGSAVTAYSEAHSLDLPKWLTDYHAHISHSSPASYYMISTFEAQMLVWLTHLVGAKRILEIGVYVGFSSMVWSHSVGQSGTVTGLEFDTEYASKAQEAFKSASLSNITLHIGDGLKTLPALSPDEPYDIIFIDAQKSGYLAYLRTILEKSQPGAENRLLRAGGLIIGDNALIRGLVADDSDANPRKPKQDYHRWADDIGKVREFNDMINGEARLEAFLLPLWDGLSLTRLLD